MIFDLSTGAKASEWPLFYLGMADYVAGKSKDPSTKCGAVVVNARKRVVSIGFNGFPESIPDNPEWYADRAEKYPMVVHAEENAIDNAEHSVAGCAIFITGHPCQDCARRIVSNRICEVHFRGYGHANQGDLDQRWRDNFSMARKILRRSRTPFVVWNDQNWIELDEAGTLTKHPDG